MTTNVSGANYTLTPQEAQLFELHSNQTPAGENKRISQYVKEMETKHKVCLVVVSAVKTLAVASTGVAIGATVGAGVGSLVEPGGGTFAGAVVGGSVGGTIGTAIGVKFAKRKITIQLKKSKGYGNWKRKALKENLYPLFEKILEENVFKGLICPITLQLPVIPVKTPCDHVYEKADLEYWLNTKNPTALCCTLGCTNQFTKNDLIFSQEHLNKIMFAAQSQIDKINKQNQTNKNDLIEGLSSIIQDAVDVSDSVFNGIVDFELQTAIRSNMGLDKFKEAMTKVYLEQQALRKLT